MINPDDPNILNPKSDFWKGYNVCLTQVLMALSDLSRDIESHSEYIESIKLYLAEDCSPSETLKTYRNRSPKYRRSKMRVVVSN